MIVNYNNIAGLLDAINTAKNEVIVTCNDGRVHINVNSFNFSYVGAFGTMVSRLILNNRISSNIPKKLIALQTCMNLYSFKNGGFNLLIK